MSPELGNVWFSDASRAITHYASGTQKDRSRWLAPTAACVETKQQLQHSKQQMIAAFEISGPRSLFFLLSIYGIAYPQRPPITSSPRRTLQCGASTSPTKIGLGQEVLELVEIFLAFRMHLVSRKKQGKEGEVSFTLQSK